MASSLIVSPLSGPTISENRNFSFVNSVRRRGPNGVRVYSFRSPVVAQSFDHIPKQLKQENLKYGGFSSKTHRIPSKLNDHKSGALTNSSYSVIEAKGNPPIMPAVMTPGGTLDLSTVLFRNRTIFIGQPINAAVAQRVISQLVTLAAIDESADILVYINCPGGNTYSVLAIYDCMSWIKPKVGTVCFGIAASQGALLLAGGEKGMRYAMPNARIMINQPHGTTGGEVIDVLAQTDELVHTKNKIDLMLAGFTGQAVRTVQIFTNRDRYMTAAEALEFGLIDGVLETEY